MFDRSISILVAISFALLVWLYARSRDPENFQSRQKTYELTNVPVSFLCPSRFSYRPQFIGKNKTGRIKLVVVGPVASESPTVRAFIDLTSDKLEVGVNIEEVQVQLPSGYKLAQDPPRSMTFELVPVRLANMAPVIPPA